jgi:hypothetical protein
LRFLKLSKANDTADEMARYLVAGLPIPDHLYDQLIGNILSEEDEQEEGPQAIDGQEAMV